MVSRRTVQQAERKRRAGNGGPEIQLAHGRRRPVSDGACWVPGPENPVLNFFGENNFPDKKWFGPTPCLNLFPFLFYFLLKLVKNWKKRTEVTEGSCTKFDETITTGQTPVECEGQPTNPLQWDIPYLFRASFWDSPWSEPMPLLGCLPPNRGLGLFCFF